MSLRGAQRRGNLLVPFIEMHSSVEILYREIATAERPRNDSTIEGFSINIPVGADAHIGPSANVMNLQEIAENRRGFPLGR